MKKIWLYMAGVAPLAFFYEELKGLVSGPAFVVIAIGYLLLVRLIAERFGR